MQSNQKLIMYKEALIPRPVLSIDLHVSPAFTGRVVLYIENGAVKCDRRLTEDEHICTLDTFIEMARDMELRIQETSNG
ncbi:hypothetical protein [Citrobacter sp. MGH110]|uniref:hypothetical protein n=1 Tax=Citrobacter sp. MGH110 TaxID=1686383 RepID=UPI00065068C7|nr:hypothetical protein [Citrobacter sp. MGH110]KLV69709.1 hypothetical protein SK38_03356 [Citrobacter sp. MGH110]